MVASVGARGRMQACDWLPGSLSSNSAPSIYQMAKVGDHMLYDVLGYFPPKNCTLWMHAWKLLCIRVHMVKCCVVPTVLLCLLKGTAA